MVPYGRNYSCGGHFNPREFYARTPAAIAAVITPAAVTNRAAPARKTRAFYHPRREWWGNFP